MRVTTVLSLRLNPSSLARPHSTLTRARWPPALPATPLHARRAAGRGVTCEGDAAARPLGLCWGQAGLQRWRAVGPSPRVHFNESRAWFRTCPWPHAGRRCWRPLRTRSGPAPAAAAAGRPRPAGCRWSPARARACAAARVLLCQLRVQPQDLPSHACACRSPAPHHACEQARRFGGGDQLEYLGVQRGLAPLRCMRAAATPGEWIILYFAYLQCRALHQPPLRWGSGALQVAPAPRRAKQGARRGARRRTTNVMRLAPASASSAGTRSSAAGSGGGASRDLTSSKVAKQNWGRGREGVRAAAAGGLRSLIGRPAFGGGQRGRGSAWGCGRGRLAWVLGLAAACSSRQDGHSVRADVGECIWLIAASNPRC